jgi:kynurenine formamidase
MKFFIDQKRYIETNSPLDISIGLSNTDENLRAWYVDRPTFDPVMEHGFVGSVSAGGNVNFRNIFFNPHGHGTHTECLGHITPEVYSVNQSLKSYFFFAEVISVNPAAVCNQEDKIWDKVILKEHLEMLLKGKQCEALVIRTLPNEETKKHLNYSSMNAAYLDVNCLEIINEIGCKHLLVDLPSVDRESDGGKLSFHHAFWQVPENPQFDKTITEFVYIDETITDGSYILELQTAPFENDATPSRPVLYRIEQ